MIVRKITAALLPVLLVAGCGGDAPQDPVSGDVDPSPAGDVAQAQVLPVGAQVWHSGFALEVLTATLSEVEENAFGQPYRELTIDARLTNEGPDPQNFFAELALVAGGRSYSSAGSTPFVPGGLTSDVTFGFAVDVDIDIDTAQLVVGRADENQARVPIGPSGGELVALQPRELPVSGELELELIDLAVTGAELRADDPANHRQVEQGRLSLWLYFDATSRRSGNWTIRVEDFALVQPSGSAVAPVGSRLDTLAGADDGRQTDGLYVRFLVDDPPEGEYTLRFTPPSWFQGDGGDEAAELAFVL